MDTAVLDELPGLRFSQAAIAADIDPTNLRNWIKRNEIKFLSPEPERGWRTFAMSDACMLALMKPLIDYGMSVRDANTIGYSLMTDNSAIMRDLYMDDGDTLRFDGDLGVFLWVDIDTGWKYTLFSLGRDFPWDLSPSPIILRIGVIFAGVFNRAMSAE